MTRLEKVFWTGASIDAALLVIFLIVTLQDSAGSGDGGRAMGIFFFIMLPSLALVLAMLLFRFTTAWLGKSIALAIVVLPAFFFAKQLIDDKIIDRRIEANRSGVGYFDSEPMRQMGAAVVQRDIATLMRIGPTVDVNAPGDDMTLMRLAVMAPDGSGPEGSELPVVRALLSLGARPDDAMKAACMRVDPALLDMLLRAGGDPNLAVTAREPLIFDTMSTITPRNFRLLAEHGLDLNSRSYDNPLPVQLTIYRRWDLLAIAIELGADMQPARPDGRTVASELASQITEAKKADQELPADLLRASQQLGASRGQ